jgi:hypothetical protein
LSLSPFEDGRKRLKNWERSQIQSFYGRNCPIGIVSGTTMLSKINLSSSFGLCLDFSLLDPGYFARL